MASTSCSARSSRDSMSSRLSRRSDRPAEGLPPLCRSPMPDRSPSKWTDGRTTNSGGRRSAKAADRLLFFLLPLRFVRAQARSCIPISLEGVSDAKNHTKTNKNLKPNPDPNCRHRRTPHASKPRASNSEVMISLNRLRFVFLKEARNHANTARRRGVGTMREEGVSGL